MNLQSLAELMIGICLLAALAALVVVVIVEGTNNLASTGLPAAVGVLAGGLLGSKIPR